MSLLSVARTHGPSNGAISILKVPPSLNPELKRTMIKQTWNNEKCAASRCDDHVQYFGYLHLQNTPSTSYNVEVEMIVQ